MLYAITTGGSGDYSGTLTLDQVIESAAIPAVVLGCRSLPFSCRLVSHGFLPKVWWKLTRLGCD